MRPIPFPADGSLGSSHIGVILIAGLTACLPSEEPHHPSASLRPCRPKGSARLAKCGTIEVPEDRQHPEKRTLRLRLVVFPAQQPSPGVPPLFLLAGGPGQSAVDTFSQFPGMLARWGYDRDLVLVDQRGAGGANALLCPSDSEDSRLENLGTVVDPVESAKRCLSALRPNANLHQYTTPHAASDLDATRSALGHARIDLFGASYGTRLALVYARMYPKHVRAMVLDGVVPVNMALPASFGEDAASAFQALDKGCQGACRDRYGSPAHQFSNLLAKIRDAPHSVTIPHPRTHQPTTLVFDEAAVHNAVRGMLYSEELSALVPSALHQAYAGNWTALGAINILAATSVRTAVSSGLYLSIICSEDVPHIPANHRSDPNVAASFGEATLQELRDVCAHWPRGRLPPQYREPIVSRAPTLLLSGALDPVTPPRWGDQVAQTLYHHQHVIVPGSAHGNLSNPCIQEMVVKFLRAEPILPINTSCLEHRTRTPFFIDYAGPPTGGTYDPDRATP